MLYFAAAIVLVALIAFVGNVGRKEVATMEFKSMLRTRIREVLDAWPAKDQYAIMFFVYPNESYEYRGYSNIPEFLMLYRCESDLENSDDPFLAAASDTEKRWNPACWDPDMQAPVIHFDDPNPFADALIDWYEALGVQEIGDEDSDAAYDSHMMYIGKGPNGLQELLQVVTELAAELQTDGTIEAKFGKRIPILIADFEFTWYMVKATIAANPNGEANEYVNACVREGLVVEAQIQ